MPTLLFHSHRESHHSLSLPTNSPVRDRLKVPRNPPRSEEHTSELQSRLHLVCRLLLEKKNAARDVSAPDCPYARRSAQPSLPTCAGRDRRAPLVLCFSAPDALSAPIARRAGVALWCCT